MSPIFISYRRDDGIDTAQLLQLNLQKMFGDDAVFLDTTTMKPGEEFPIELQNAVRNSKIIIAMIGKNWKGNDPQVNRLKQEKDWVCRELEIALADEKKKIFPVFVKGATRSAAFTDLPPSLERLTSFNYAELREKEFKQDLLPLVPLMEPFIDLENPLKDLPLDEDNYPYPPGSPFKGLDFFREKDAKLFFGRGNEIRKLYNNIRNRNIIMLYGPSGSGKSSLLFAGLKPRMDNQKWNTQYIRREAGINLAQKLDVILSSINEGIRQLVILDQVEEIFTNPNSILTPDAEALQLLTSVKNAAEKKIHILLSFRKEYLAEIEKIFGDLLFEKIYLEPLEIKGVLEAIRGITLSDEARDNYDLKFADNDVPIAIAQAVLGDEDSYVAPLLQVLLRKMWDKVQDKNPRIFSKELLEDVKSSSLATLLSDQINAVKEKFPKEVASGLVLDLLYFFTTPRGTSASRTENELVNQYSYPDILKIVTALKDKYLLTEPNEPDQQNLNTTRLAHDALGPLIREMYAQSSSPAQRASRLLESKTQDIEAGAEVEFSKYDLAIIDDGKLGMRKRTQTELKAIEKSKIKIEESELELEEKNKQLELALKESHEQTLQAKSKALAATAREIFPTDPTIALRLAEAACGVATVVSKEVKSAIRDMLAQEEQFYKLKVGGHTGITSVAFSPESKYILTGSWDKIARVWNLDGTLKQSFEGHRDSISSVAFSPNGQYILTGSGDNTARLWNLDGTLKQSFKGHKDHVISVTFSPDGKYILTGSWDKTARLWTLDGILKQSFKGPRDRVGSVAFSPDGKYILTGSQEDKTANFLSFNKITCSAKLWNLDGSLRQSFEGHTGSIKSVAFSPDSKYILTGSEDKTARLWNLDGSLRQSFEEHAGSITSVAFSPDGKHILTGSEDKIARLWGVDGFLKQSFKGHAGHITAVAFSSNENCILTGSSDTTARLWNLDGGLKQSFKEHADDTTTVAFSPDGKYIFTGRRDTTARLWNLDGSLRQSFQGHTASILSVAFSPDGKYIFTGSEDKIARLWNLNGRLRQSFEGHTGSISSVAFSPDGKYVLTGSWDTTARLWDVDGTLRHSFVGHSGSIESVVFSPEGKYILTGSLDETARIWNLSGTALQSFDKHSGITVAAFWPNGKYIITGSEEKGAKLWNLDGTLKQCFSEYEVISSIVFSPDGKYILTRSWSDRARLWDLDGTLMQIFEAPGDINSIVFSPDGKLILSGGNKISLWRPFWEILNPENTYVPSPGEMKEYDIPADIQWGKIW